MNFEFDTDHPILTETALQDRWQNRKRGILITVNDTGDAGYTVFGDLDQMQTIGILEVIQKLLIVNYGGEI